MPSSGADQADQALAALHGGTSPGASQHSATAASAILEGSREGESSNAASLANSALPPTQPATLEQPAPQTVPGAQQPVGAADADAGAAAAEDSAHTVGAFAPEVSVQPVAGDGAGKAAPIAEPAEGAVAGSAPATEPASGDATAVVSGAAAMQQPAGASSSLATATADSMELPKPHDASREMATEQVGLIRMATLPRSCNHLHLLPQLHIRCSGLTSAARVASSTQHTSYGAQEDTNTSADKGMQAGTSALEAALQAPSLAAADSGKATTQLGPQPTEIQASPDPKTMLSWIPTAIAINRAHSESTSSACAHDTL